MLGVGVVRLGAVLVILSAGFGGRQVAAQTQEKAQDSIPAQASVAADRWQLTVDSAQYIWDVRLVKLDGDALVVRQADSLVRVPVEHINEMRLIRKSTMEVGTEGRDVMSALIGSNDRIYDLSPLSFLERLRAIERLLGYYPPADD